MGTIGTANGGRLVVTNIMARIYITFPTLSTVRRKFSIFIIASTSKAFGRVAQRST